jgi:hypothetical protein
MVDWLASVKVPRRQNYGITPFALLVQKSEMTPRTYGEDQSSGCAYTPVTTPNSR